MDFGNITSRVWSNFTWPLSSFCEPIKQSTLGSVLGWSVVWIPLHIGYTVFVYLAVLIILSLIVDRFGIVTINSQWKRIFEIMKSRPLLFNTVNSCGVLVQINAIHDLISDNLMFSVGFILGIVIGMWI